MVKDLCAQHYTDTGGSRYRCPCGDDFSRRDVLSRHLRRCDAAQQHQHLFPSDVSKQARTKTACDRCCQLKLKCDSKRPVCQQCQNSSRPCKYTRPGFSDPYCAFRVPREADSTTSPSNASLQTSAEAPIAISGDSGETSSTAIAPPPYMEDTFDQIATAGDQHLGAGMCANTSVSGAGDLDFGSSFDFTSSLDPLFFFPDTMAGFDLQSPLVTQPHRLETHSGRHVLAKFGLSIAKTCRYTCRSNKASDGAFRNTWLLPTPDRSCRSSMCRDKKASLDVVRSDSGFKRDRVVRHPRKPDNLQRALRPTFPAQCPYSTFGVIRHLPCISHFTVCCHARWCVLLWQRDPGCFGHQICYAASLSY